MSLISLNDWAHMITKLQVKSDLKNLLEDFTSQQLRKATVLVDSLENEFGLDGVSKFTNVMVKLKKKT